MQVSHVKERALPLPISQEHTELGHVVREFAGKNDLLGQARAALDTVPAELDSALGAMADLGWLGLHLPGELGGSDAGLAELAVVLDELGAAVAPGPFLPAVIGSAVINAVGTGQLKTDLLPAAAAGTSVIAYGDGNGLAVTDETVAGQTTGGPTVTGRVARVAGGAWADQLVLAYGADLLVIPAGGELVSRAVLDGLDPGLGLAAFELSAVPVTVVPGTAAQALAIARTLAAASAAGGARSTLGAAVGYAQVREQFGRTIGSFQAVKHILADMLADSELATAAAWDAARTVDHSLGDSADYARGGGTAGQAELAAAVAAVIALAGFQRNAQRSIQVHGGIGFTWEHDAHLYLRRALALTALFGPEHAAADDVTRLIADGVRPERAVDLPESAEQFRQAAREFKAGLTAAPPERQRALWADSGYLVPHWRRPWGRAASPVEQLVIEEELAGLGRPSMGIGEWVVLSVSSHGTPEQLERWIWPSLRGELLWCQLFSEPGAGSDAAAVRTKAVKVDGGWRVTGQKVWTSTAQFCNRGLATVRTDQDAPKHQGITAVVIDLKAPGVEVRPLREITGDAMFNEVFFDDVFVPDADVVGEVNGGWAVARTTLSNERVSIGGGMMAGAAFDLLPVIDAHAPGDTGLRREAGRLLADEVALSAINLRRVARAVTGAQPGPEGAVTKVITAQHLQRVSELAIRVAGPAGIDGSEPQRASSYLYGRSMTIAGGTTEIGKNVIAERILGMPRDPLNR
jgi:alkylation response protein AidB-like acyl-CoA dehydrogenase